MSLSSLLLSSNGSIFSTSILFRTIKNLSPMMAGYVMTVHPLIMVLIAPIAGSLSDKHGAKTF